jgi:hypothetical protein
MLEIVSFFSLLFTAAVVAYIARRILGAPIGWPRSIIVAILMMTLLGSSLPMLGRAIGLADTAGGVRSPVIAGVVCIDLGLDIPAQHCRPGRPRRSWPREVGVVTTPQPKITTSA